MEQAAGYAGSIGVPPGPPPYDQRPLFQDRYNAASTAPPHSPLRDVVGPPRFSDTAPLLVNAEPGNRAVGGQEPAAVHRPVESFSFEKFVFAWLGIGRSYSVFCQMIYISVFLWGIAVIGLSVASISTVPGTNFVVHSQLLLTYSFCIVSGITFLLIGCCLPLTYCWNKRRPVVNERSFTGLGFYSCFLVVMMVLCTGIMSVLMYEQTLVVSTSAVPFSLYVYQVLTPFLVVGSMGGVLVLSGLLGYCCCCWNRREFVRTGVV